MDEAELETGGVGEAVRLGLWLLVTWGLAPWVVLTATLSQVHPELQPVMVEVEGTNMLVEPAFAYRLAFAGSLAAGWIGALLAIVLPVLYAMSRWQLREAERFRDLGVLEDAVVAGASVEVSVKRSSPSTPPRPVPSLSEPERRAAEPTPGDEVAGSAHNEAASATEPAEAEPGPLVGAEEPLAREEELDDLFR